MKPKRSSGKRSGILWATRSRKANSGSERTWGRLWLKFRSNTLVISGAPAPVWMQMAMPSRLAASYTGKKYDSASERSPSTPRKKHPHRAVVPGRLDFPH